MNKTEIALQVAREQGLEVVMLKVEPLPGELPPEPPRRIVLELTEEEALALRYMLGFGEMRAEAKGELAEMEIDADKVLAAVDERLHAGLEPSGVAPADVRG